MLRVCVIGRGPIAAFVAGHLVKSGEAVLLQLLLRPGAVPGFGDGADVITTADAVRDVDVVADCAGVAGLSTHGPALLQRGFRVMTLSAAAFADPLLEAAVLDAARAGGGQLVVAGAVGAVDALSAAVVFQPCVIRAESRQRAGGGPLLKRRAICRRLGPLVHSARVAARRYPKNANVAATTQTSAAGRR